MNSTFPMVLALCLALLYGIPRNKLSETITRRREMGEGVEVEGEGHRGRNCEAASKTWN